MFYRYIQRSNKLIDFNIIYQKFYPIKQSICAQNALRNFYLTYPPNILWSKNRIKKNSCNDKIKAFNECFMSNEIFYKQSSESYSDRNFHFKNFHHQKNNNTHKLIWYTCTRFGIMCFNIIHKNSLKLFIQLNPKLNEQ